MTRDPNYIPKSAKASDFKITLSKGASEDGERVSFLEQQIQQSKETYESSLKNVIEECITLETNALQSQEYEIIYSPLPALAEAINTLEGLNTNVHQKVITLLYLDSSFLSHTTATSRETFITSYCAHHNLDTIPSPSIHPLTNTYITAAQRDKEQLLHTKSLQLPENKGLQTFLKTVECVVTVPSVSFETQVDENNKEIILKQLSTEIIMGKTTEDTAMELDGEGGASFEQLQDLIKKECDKRDKKYRSLEQKYNKLQDSFNSKQSEKNTNEGPTRRLEQKEITNRKSSTGPKPTWPPNNNKTGTTYGSSTIPSRTARKSRRYQQRHYKRQSHKIQREQAITIAAEEKAFYHRLVQVTTTITNKIKQQFGFVADPKKTLLHNASSTLATTPTWYYFSRPSHLAFHDFTQQKQPAKNLRSLLGLG